MVILSTVAVSNEFEGGELLSSVIKLGAYLLFGLSEEYSLSLPSLKK
jgi:hypothetical protein